MMAWLSEAWPYLVGTAIYIAVFIGAVLVLEYATKGD